MKKNPVLSILIPSIPSRFEKAKDLYKNIIALLGSHSEEVEVLMLVDNKMRTIGEKRESLKNMSNGDFFMFVDDDDYLVKIDSVFKTAKNNPTIDVITFKQRCRNEDGSSFIVTFGLGNEIEHNSVDGRYIDSKRPPFHVCAWNKKFKKYSFGDVNYGEDWVFVEQCLKEAQTEIFIDEIVHSYNFDISVSEADTASNKFWQNPNESPAKAKKCVVTLSTNSKYKKGVERMAESMKKFKPEDVDFIFFNSEFQVGAPKHEENPYAFKLYAIMVARSMGYDQIIWLDSSIVAVKDFTPVFDWLTEKGIFLEEAGHWAGRWSNDYCLNYFFISREDANKIPMFAAGYCGFDFRNHISNEFFAEWFESMLNGCFKGSWIDHRHDMTCGSIIAGLRNLTNLYSPGGQFFSYIGKNYQEPLPTSVFHLIGL